MCFNAVYIFPPSPLPINSHNSLRVTENTINTFESARAVEVVFQAWSVNFLDFFLAACRQSFPEGIITRLHGFAHGGKFEPGFVENIEG